MNGKVDVVCTSLFYRGEERISIKIQTKFQKDTPYLDHGSCSIINLKRIGDPFDFRLVEGGVTFWQRSKGTYEGTGGVERRLVVCVYYTQMEKMESEQNV